ncbi:tyrosine recombinase XerC [Halobacteriovorax sp. ZH5_bin.2]|uniref:site-specific integrase n=1 Tax=Halobacteriovorax sp. ZH5_bin.2 TaxID=3157727 RepID=UPI00372060A5
MKNAKKADSNVLYLDTGLSKPKKTTKKKTQKKKSKRVFRVDMRMLDGRRVTKSFRRKHDAEQFKAKLKVENEMYETTGQVIQKDVTVKEFCELWFDEVAHGRKSPKTIKGYHSTINQYLIPTLGNIKLKFIEYNHARKVENFILRSGKTNRTVNKNMMNFKTIMNDAEKMGYIFKNKIRGYKELKQKSRDLSYWSKEEVKQFLDYTRDHDELHDLYELTLNTGLRLGEVVGLCWDKVDFEGNQLVISRSMKREGLIENTKSGKTRYIPMNDKVRAILKNRLKTQMRGPFIFSKEDGTPVRYDHITQRNFKPSQINSGVSRIIRFHDLRHTFASHFVMNGGNIYVLQQLLGHNEIQTTMIYAHLDKKFMQRACEFISF